MKTKSVIFTSLLLVILIPSAALAVDFDYYVYGGFDAVVNAFNKLALFGDNGYMSFYAFSIAAGIFFGCVTIAARILGAGSGSPMSWIVPALVGIGIYLSLAVPKGTLHIYDPVYNKNQAIGGIPAGVVAVAGILNSVERGSALYIRFISKYFETGKFTSSRPVFARSTACIMPLGSKLPWLSTFTLPRFPRSV